MSAMLDGHPATVLSASHKELWIKAALAAIGSRCSVSQAVKAADDFIEEVIEREARGREAGRAKLRRDYKLDNGDPGWPDEAW